MASLLKNIAEPYSKDKVYNTKDMVLYNNLLYLCIYNNVSGEFNSSKWIEVQLTDLVQGKLRGIEDYSGKVIDASYVEQDDNYTYFGVPQKAFVDNETSFRTSNSNLDYELDNENTFILNNGVEKSVPNNAKYMFHYEGGLSNFTFMIGEVVTESKLLDFNGNYHNIGVVKSVDGKLKSYGDCFVSKIK